MKKKRRKPGPVPSGLSHQHSVRLWPEQERHLRLVMRQKHLSIGDAFRLIFDEVLENRMVKS